MWSIWPCFTRILVSAHSCSLVSIIAYLYPSYFATQESVQIGLLVTYASTPWSVTVAAFKLYHNERNANALGFSQSQWMHNIPSHFPEKSNSQIKRRGHDPYQMAQTTENISSRRERLHQSKHPSPSHWTQVRKRNSSSKKLTFQTLCCLDC